MIKLLITGASGFVGGKLAARARAHGGFEVHGLGRRARPDDANYTACDLTQPLTLGFRPDVVVHAAARSSPWGTREEFLRNNVEATRHVIEFCEHQGCPKLIYISSSSVFYRNEHQLGLTEDSPIGPDFVNTYAETKFLGEKLVARYQGPSAILRPRAVFGPDDTVLFPRILRAARAGRLPYFTTEGPPALGDLIYIDTLSDYILRAARDSSVTGDFNLTNNAPIPIMELLLRIFRELGIPEPTRRLPVRRALRLARGMEAIYRILPFLGEPPITRFGVGVFAYSKTFDVSKTLRVLGQPSVSLDDGIEAFVRWQRTQ